MRGWIWLACAACGGARPSRGIESAGGAPGPWRSPAGYDAGTRLPASVNVAGGYTLGPAVDGRDRGILYFTGKRPEASAGKLDVYRVRYAPRPAR